MGCPGIRCMLGCMPDPCRGVPLSLTSASRFYILAWIAGDGGTLGLRKPCGSLMTGPSCPPAPHPHLLVYGVRALVMGVTLSGAAGIHGLCLNSQQVCDLTKHPCQLCKGLGTHGDAGIFCFRYKSTCCEGLSSHLNCSFHPFCPQVGLLIHSLKIL